MGGPGVSAQERGVRVEGKSQSILPSALSLPLPQPQVVLRRNCISAAKAPCTQGCKFY